MTKNFTIDNKAMTKKKIDILINSVVFIICIALIIVADNWPTGNWVVPYLTVVLTSFLTIIQLVLLALSIFLKKTNPLNWTLIFPLLILIAAIYNTVHFMIVCPAGVY